MDEEIFSKQFQVEQKIIYVDVKENKNGRYIKISEKSGGKKHNVLMPLAGLRRLKLILDEICKTVGDDGGENER